mgnify:CR=1 FL=1
MAILAAVLVPTVTSKIKDARESGAKSDMSAIANSIQSEIISIHSGLSSTDNKYVAGSDGAVTGVKTPDASDNTVQKDGKVTITYDATNKKFVITHSDLDTDKTYEVSTETGAVTNNAQ